MSKVFVVGTIYIESQIFVDELPKENEVQIASSNTSFIGSKTINLSKVLRKHGIDVDYCGMAGDDKEGSLVLKEFKDNGITQNVIFSENKVTGKITVITNKSGKNSIIIFKGANDHLSPRDIEANHIINQANTDKSDYDLIYSVTSLNIDTLDFLIELSNKINVPLFLDISHNHKLIELDKLKDVAFVTMNKHEAGLLLDSEVITPVDAQTACRRIRETCKGNIIITLDKDGIVFLEKSKKDPMHIPGIKVTGVVDETGAGDILRGVFIAQYLKTKKLKSSLEKAQEVAAESVKIKGILNKIENIT